MSDELLGSTGMVAPCSPRVRENRKRDPGRRVIGTHLGPFVGLGLAASEPLQRARVKPQQLIPGLGSV